MSPSPPKPPAPAPPPPTIDQAAQQADASDLIRRRKGFAATELTRGSVTAPATRSGTSAILGN